MPALSKTTRTILIGIGLLVIAAGFVSMSKWTEYSRRRACIYQMRQVKGAIDEWAMLNNKLNTDPVTLAELEPYFIKGLPKCPAGGEYRVATVVDLPSCTIPGHTLLPP